MSAGAVPGSRWQLTVAIAVSLALELVGFLMVTNSTGDMRTFGWFIVVVGAIFTGLNLAMRKMR